MSVLNAAFGALWRGAYALRRTQPPLSTSRDRILWLGNQIAGVRITEDEALRLSAVWACVSVISKSLASCQWDVFIEQRNGDRIPRRDTVSFNLLNARPNSEMNSFAFREAAMIQALVYGNFYAEIETDISGVPINLWPLMPDRCIQERDDDGNVVVRVVNQDRGDSILPYNEVFHLHGPGLDGFTGFDVVSVAARSLAHSAAAERFGQAYYGNGTQMGGILSTPSNVSAEQQKEIRAQLEERHQGPDQAFRFLLLGGDMKYSALNAAPNDAQFLETRQHQIEEVCRWFGVPPHKIAHLLRATNNNIEHQGIEYTRDALVPWAERMAQEADWKLLPNWRGIKSRLDLDWLAEGDAKSKAETDSILVNAGIRTRNEVRKQRGLNTAKDENADKLTVQMNMTILEKLAEDPPEAEPEPDADPFEPVAGSLIRNAVRKGLGRRTHAAIEASKRAPEVLSFASEIDKDNEAHARFLGDQINAALNDLNKKIPADRFRSIMVAALEEEREMLCAAYVNGDLAGWCDREKRAADIATKLVALMKD